MKKAIFLIIPFLFFWKTGVCQDNEIHLLTNEDFTYVDLHNAVNYFVELGEKKGFAKLSELSNTKDEKEDSLKCWKRIERVSWICRILYSPKEGKFLRPPGYGSLILPTFSMPLEKWQLYPIAKTGKTYVVLSGGYSIAGLPEPPKFYLNYCANNGEYRKKKLYIPSKKEAFQDIKKLRQSERWQFIKWKDQAEGKKCHIDENWAWRYIYNQISGDDMCSDKPFTYK